MSASPRADETGERVPFTFANWNPDEGWIEFIFMAAGFTDTFRMLHPDEAGAYSWWSYRGNARKNNTGWRINYFLVSDGVAEQVRDATIRPEIFGSDHCPVELVIEL